MENDVTDDDVVYMHMISMLMTKAILSLLIRSDNDGISSLTVWSSSSSLMCFAEPLLCF